MTEKDTILDTVNIEKVPSRKATIMFVSTVQKGKQFVLRGKVGHRQFSRGPIPGYIDLKIISQDGAILEKSKISYHRHSTKSRYASFSITLKATPPPGSTIRMRHRINVF